MYKLFSQNKIKYISFDDLQNVVKAPSNYLIINTMNANKQDCLIKHTIDISNEEKYINELVNNYDYYSKTIIIYGENCNDNSVEEKNNQICNLGFKNVYIYKGGLFEWLLLQDIYGNNEFQTNTQILDILKYKSKKIL
tara:strand:+ start:1065 stop:1478 length:414 start_codon:yes stop_codon:yes gene_type:complete